jgi:hypothetical protein
MDLIIAILATGIPIGITGCTVAIAIVVMKRILGKYLAIAIAARGIVLIVARITEGVPVLVMQNIVKGYLLTTSNASNSVNSFVHASPLAT